MNSSGNNIQKSSGSTDAKMLQSQAQELEEMIDQLRSQASELREQASKLSPENSSSIEDKNSTSGFQLSRPEGTPAPESSRRHHSSSRHHHSSSGESSSHRHSSSSGESSSHHHSSSGESSSHRHSSSSGESSSHHHSSSSGESSSHHHSSSSGGSSSHRHSSSSGESSSHHHSSSSGESSSHHHSSSSGESSSHHHSSSSDGSSSKQRSKKRSSAKHHNTKSKFKKTNIFKNLRASLKMQSSSNTGNKIRMRKYKWGSSNRSKRKGVENPNMPKEKKRIGSKAKLIIGAVISAMIVLVIGGYAAYKTVVVPMVIEPALEKAAQFIADDRYSSALTREIRRLYQEGQISGSEVEQYLKTNDETVAEYIPGAAYTGGSSGRQSADGSSTDSSDSPYDPVTGVADTSKKSSNSSSLGVNSVNVRDENSSTASGSRYSENASITQNADQTLSRAELLTLSGSELLEKARTIMSAEDFALAMSLRSKIDSGRLSSLRSDTDAAIAYIQSCLSPSEYSQMLTIYAKYANHLTQ